MFAIKHLKSTALVLEKFYNLRKTVWLSICRIISRYIFPGAHIALLLITFWHKESLEQGLRRQTLKDYNCCRSAMLSTLGCLECEQLSQIPLSYKGVHVAGSRQDTSRFSYWAMFRGSERTTQGGLYRLDLQSVYY